MTIEQKDPTDQEVIPERYSTDSDDHLMNTLISKGYAFAREKGASLKIKVDCGCNCNCCFGQAKTDMWELSKDCGCDCGCCNNNSFKSTHQPQFYIDRKGALAAAREIVAKNKRLSGQALEDYLNFNFGETWDHYDVLGKGIIEIEQMSSFYKKMLKDFTVSLQ